MIFNGIIKTEALFFHLDSNRDEMCCIEMERNCDEGVLCVRSCNDDWEWNFFDEASNYELVKHAIFDVAFGANNTKELIYGLDEIFESVFKKIVAWEGEEVCDCDGDCDCNGGCNHCGCKK